MGVPEEELDPRAGRGFEPRDNRPRYCESHEDDPLDDEESHSVDRPVLGEDHEHEDPGPAKSEESSACGDGEGMPAQTEVSQSRQERTETEAGDAEHRRVRPGSAVPSLPVRTTRSA